MQPQRQQENGEQAGFEQQVVPLEGQKIPAHHHQREVTEPGHSQAGCDQATKDHQRCRHRAQEPDGVERGLTGGEPQQRRHLVPSVAAELRFGRGQIGRERENALRPDQPLDLPAERHEGEHVDAAEHAHKKVRGHLIAPRGRPRLATARLGWRRRRCGAFPFRAALPFTLANSRHLRFPLRGNSVRAGIVFEPPPPNKR